MGTPIYFSKLLIAECQKSMFNVIYTHPNKTKCSEEHIPETPLYEKVGNFKVNCFSNHY